MPKPWQGVGMGRPAAVTFWALKRGAHNAALNVAGPAQACTSCPAPLAGCTRGRELASATLLKTKLKMQALHRKISLPFFQIRCKNFNFIRKGGKFGYKKE